MMKVVVGYNTKEEELEIARRVAQNSFETIEQKVSKEDIEIAAKEMRDIHLDPQIEEYIIELVRATRELENYGLEEYKPFVEFGASPRASIDLYKASRAVAYIKGYDHVSPIEIAYIAKEVLRHRIVLSYEAQASDITQDDIINKILSAVPIP
jgi:MoxR-like ATPase